LITQDAGNAAKPPIVQEVVNAAQPTLFKTAMETLSEVANKIRYISTIIAIMKICIFELSLYFVYYYKPAN